MLILKESVVIEVVEVDLDMPNMMEEAKSRWLRPNEIHAVLCNHKLFSISVKPVTKPSSGTIVLFDRKMLRNFRKDGHNWKKKKDGKTVKEAHEHLKVSCILFFSYQVSPRIVGYTGKVGLDWSSHMGKVSLIPIDTNRIDKKD
ncbi:calmodulin-binding transcription activator 5 [Tanacetum coccineum]